MANETALLMTSEEMDRALKRISHEILEQTKGGEDVVILGIKRRGIPLAKKIVNFIKSIEGIDIPLGELDITFYRDDLSIIDDKRREPIINSLKDESVPFDITDKNVILVDDVLYTGRTTRAALDACSKYGRAKTIKLAVLIDRGHRELPIKADFIGKNVPTSKKERISVMVPEIDGAEQVLLFKD